MNCEFVVKNSVDVARVCERARRMLAESERLTQRASGRVWGVTCSATGGPPNSSDDAGEECREALRRKAEKYRESQRPKSQPKRQFLKRAGADASENIEGDDFRALLVEKTKAFIKSRGFKRAPAFGRS
jgi:hypothetical protein